MFKFSGIGSAFNTRLGNNSAYVKRNGELFVIDCGSSVFHKMKESGLLEDVGHIHIYITHTHADHIGSLADMIFYMFYTKGEQVPRVSVYAMFDLDVQHYLRLNGITKEYIYHHIDDSTVTKIKSLELSFVPFQTTHVDELKSYGLVIKDYSTGAFIAYTGDTNYLSDDINKMFADEGLDRLYVDTCSQDYEGNVHLSLFKLYQIIDSEHRNKVWCMHLDEKFDIEQAKSLGFNVVEVEL